MAYIPDPPRPQFGTDADIAHAVDVEVDGAVSRGGAGIGISVPRAVPIGSACIHSQ